MTDDFPLITRGRRLSIGAIAGIWLAALAIALLLDPYVERLVLHFGPFNKESWPAVIIRFGGVFWDKNYYLPGVPLVAAVLLTFFHPSKWKAGALLVTSAGLGGLFYVLAKWIVGRQRPPMRNDVTIPYHTPYDFHPFKNGITALWHAPIAMGFPSGHTTLAFATACILSICLPRGRWIFYALAAIVGIERIAEYTHYLSDVVAGAGLGILAAHLTLRLAAGLSRPPVGSASADRLFSSSQKK